MIPVDFLAFVGYILDKGGWIMPRILEPRKPSNLSTPSMDKPAMPLRSNLSPPSIRSVGSGGGYHQNRPGANGGTIYEDDDDYEGDWGDF
jgi:hypothetical protein